jgi:hypothetical protein
MVTACLSLGKFQAIQGAAEKSVFFFTDSVLELYGQRFYIYPSKYQLQNVAAFLTNITICSS